MTNQSSNCIPLVRISKAFGQDVCGLSVGILLLETKERFFEEFMKPLNADTVFASNVSHCRVLSRVHHLDHSLVVFEYP